MGESSDQATTSRMPADSGQSAVAPENGVTPLMKACQGENVKDVKTLLDQGVGLLQILEGCIIRIVNVQFVFQCRVSN
jgi:hypothetical protein